MQYKNTPKIKVLQMLSNFNMIFLEYLRIFGTENTSGEPTPGHEGPGRAPCLVGPCMVSPLHLFQQPHTPSSSQKNHQPAQARVVAHFAAIFDLLAQSSTHKTALEDCSSVCDSSNGPTSFLL